MSSSLAVWLTEQSIQQVLVHSRKDNNFASKQFYHIK
jgi:hypothetical protein